MTLAAPVPAAAVPAAPATAAPAPAVPAQRAAGSSVGQAGTGAGTGGDRYLTFSLGGELYALSILDVVEIIEYRTLTTVPRMPDFIRGVLNLRGAAVPVVDLSTRFGREATSIAHRTGIVIVDAARHGAADGRGNGGDSRGNGGDEGNSGSEGRRTPARLGILVDAVNKVLHVSAGEIEPPPDLGTDLRADVISGMARHEEQFIVILDLEHLLAGALTD